MDQFGDRIRSLRKEKKVTQKQLAEFIGVQEQTIRMYEKNARERPHPHILAELAQYFGVSIGYLVGIEDDPTPNPVPQNPLHMALTPQDAKLLKAIYDDPDGSDLMYNLKEEEIKLLLAFWKGMKARRE